MYRPVICSLERIIIYNIIIPYPESNICHSGEIGPLFLLNLIGFTLLLFGKGVSKLFIIYGIYVLNFWNREVVKGSFFLRDIIVCR